jgi:hypothetical protein
MTKTDYILLHESLCERMVKITRAKNADYSGAGDDPFANFRQIGHLLQTPNAVEQGFLTRMSDKMARIASFIAKGQLQVKDESVEDTLLDLANYCLLMIGFIKDKQGWKPQPPAQVFEEGQLGPVGEHTPQEFKRPLKQKRSYDDVSV